MYQEIIEIFIDIINFVLINYLEEDHSINDETHRLKNLVNFPKLLQLLNCPEKLSS